LGIHGVQIKDLWCIVNNAVDASDSALEGKESGADEGITEGGIG
jgi:hypothetical protein